MHRIRCHTTINYRPAVLYVRFTSMYSLSNLNSPNIILFFHKKTFLLLFLPFIQVPMRAIVVCLGICVFNSITILTINSPLPECRLSSIRAHRYSCIIVHNVRTKPKSKWWKNITKPQTYVHKTYDVLLPVYKSRQQSNSYYCYYVVCLYYYFCFVFIANKHNIFVLSTRQPTCISSDDDDVNTNQDIMIRL